MSGTTIGLLATLFTTLASGIAWVIKRRADKQDRLDQERRQRELDEQARRVTDRPEFQKIIAEQTESFMERLSAQNSALVQENIEQRRQHAIERDEWHKAREKEREAWEIELNRRDETIRSLRQRLGRLEEQFDQLSQKKDTGENE